MRIDIIIINKKRIKRRWKKFQSIINKYNFQAEVMASVYHWLYCASTIEVIQNKYR